MEIEPLNMKCQAQTILQRTGWSRAQLVFHTAFTSTLSYQSKRGSYFSNFITEQSNAENRVLWKKIYCYYCFLGVTSF